MNSLPIDEVQKVFEKLSKHTRIEEAAIKRIKDLEMHIGNIRNSYGVSSSNLYEIYLGNMLFHKNTERNFELESIFRHLDITWQLFNISKIR